MTLQESMVRIWLRAEHGAERDDQWGSRVLRLANGRVLLIDTSSINVTTMSDVAPRYVETFSIHRRIDKKNIVPVKNWTDFGGLCKVIQEESAAGAHRIWRTD